MSTSPAPGADRRADALLALSCLDLTSLNDHETEADIARLCERANGSHGTVAAVCVWPRWVGFVRARLPASIAVAAVANFPSGDADAAAVTREVAAIVEAGAQEVDVVLPWRRLLAGDASAAAAVVAAARQASAGQRLKLIIESGELREPGPIDLACRIGLDAGVDFLKTSTGKTPTGATAAAAERMLQAIAAHPLARTRVGFKASGGVRRVADAAAYAAQVRAILGDAAVSPQRFRLGASGLLDDIEAVLQGRDEAPATGSRY